MDSVGQQLRQARARLGVSLEEVSAKTRIAVRVLEAIENDDVSRLGGAFFYRSFVRQFAEYVELPYSDLESAVQLAAGSVPEAAAPRQTVEYLPKVAPLRSRGSKSRWLYSAGSFVIMLAACSTLSAIWQKSRANWEHSIENSVRSLMNAAAPAQRSATEVPQAKQQAMQLPLPAIPLPSIPDAVEADDAAFHIEVSAIEPTWLSIVADGRRKFRGILRRTQTKVLDGHEVARIRTGNAGGVSVVFNGKVIGPLGLPGEVLTAIFTKDRYKILEPATHMALLRSSQTAE
jgi:transcriptional regulator with XRE-family HTH domain